MPRLIIYDASAGAGKTYTLVKHFLLTALANSQYAGASPHWNRFQFCHTLCVTFTRKATAEMKQRILLRLYEIASKTQQTSPLLDELCTETGLSIEELRKRARLTLQTMLQNFSLLGVFTIDSFIQQIFDALVWELNLKPEQNITTETRTLLQEAAARVLLQLNPSSREKEERALYEWCKEHATEAIENNRTWRIEKKLFLRGFQLFADRFTLKTAKECNDFFSVNTFANIQRKLLNTKREFEKEVTSLYETIVKNLNDNDINPLYFSYGNSSGWQTTKNCVLALKKEAIPIDFVNKKRPYELAQDPNAWFPKTKKNDGEENSLRLTIIEQYIYPFYKTLYHLLTEQASDYNTAILALKKLPELALLNKLREALNAIEKEEALLLLNDLATILYQLAQENDSSFIFERMGMRYEQIFIDEFQDTSRLHWKLLAPFIDNALSGGGQALLVGDVKQAIYRWRGGDWKLLATEIPQTYQNKERYPDELLSQRSLDTNFRSAREVVRFNNELFRCICNIFPTTIDAFKELLPSSHDNSQPPPDVDNLCEKYKTLVQSAYHNVQQQYSEHAPAGYVQCTLLHKDERTTKEDSTQILRSSELEYTLQLLDLLAENNIAPEQIAILLRTNRTAQCYAEAIMQEGKFAVISQDAFLLDKSADVQLLLAALRIASSNTPNDIDTLLLAQFLNRTALILEQQPWYYERKGNYSALLASAIDWLHSIATLPLLELFDAIVFGLLLPSSEGELPYLADLRDRVYTFHKNQNNSVYAFLESYQAQDATKRNIEATTSGAINILTIHKAKGLEFDVVICPELILPFVANSNDTVLWADNIPIKTSEEIENFTLPHGGTQQHFLSHFALSTLEEYCLAAVDALNLCYVAFTRAKKALYIVLTDAQKKLTTASFILPALSTIEWEKEEKDETSHFTLFSRGDLCSVQHTNNHTTYNNVAPITVETPKRALFQQIKLKVEMVTESIQDRCFGDLLHRKDATSRGTQLHDIMMYLNKLEDLQVVESFLLTENNYTPEHVAQIIENFKLKLTSEPLQQCFEPNATIWSEHEFVDSNGKIVRPDRLVFLPEKTVVIDFKFGKKHTSHKRQIRAYTTLLADLHYPTPCGFLWYIDLDEAKSEVLEIAL